MIWNVPLATRLGFPNLGDYIMATPRTPAIYPTLSGNTLYVANRLSAWAVDARAGTVLWRYDTRETGGQALPKVGAAQARQPLVADGVVYVPLDRPPVKEGGFGIVTNLYALDAASGRPFWRWGPQDSGPEFAELAVDGQPVLCGDMVLIALGMPKSLLAETRTAAIDRRTGKLVWAQPLASYAAEFLGSAKVLGDEVA